MQKKQLLKKQLKQQSQQPRKQLQKKLKGQKGEQLAKKLLLSKGYNFLVQNYTTPIGEIDLIFEDEKSGQLVFVEVKARTSLTQGIPEEAVTPRKLATIIKVSQWFMLEHQLENRLARVDVVAVEMIEGKDIEIRHLEDVSG